MREHMAAHLRSALKARFKTTFGLKDNDIFTLCKICHKSLVSRASLVRHMMSIHNISKEKVPETTKISRLCCNMCDFSSFNQSILEKHVKMKHNYDKSAPVDTTQQHHGPNPSGPELPMRILDTSKELEVRSTNRKAYSSS